MPAPSHSLRLFLSVLMKSPKQVGAVWPSSPALGEAMARWLPEDKGLPILELGPGTGVVTGKLLEAGLPQEHLVAVEKSERLAGFLRERFPRMRVIAGDALELEQIFPDMKFGAVISSLPLKLFSPEQVERIAAGIHSLLLPGASWVQFSYQIINGRVPSDAFHAIGSKIVWQNLPPAKVSVYRPRA